MQNTNIFQHVLRGIGLYCYIAILGVIRANIDKKLELKFREYSMKKFGYAKGALTRAIEEAILKWLSEVEFSGDPVEAIDGLLQDIDVDSVDLQHMIRKFWAGKVLGSVSD